MIEPSTGTILSGDDAPLLSQLPQWLEANPGWEVADTDDEDDDDDDHCKFIQQQRDKP